MIIKIEDAPSIKHIKIDIDFDDGEPSVRINQDTNGISSINSPAFADPTSQKDTPKKSIMDDVKLDTNETYEISNEVIEKPEIPEHDREVKVASDMESLEL